jgi:hypothetical protein
MAAHVITGASLPTYTGRVGPWTDSNGYLWTVALNASNQATAYKSTDRGFTWTAIGSYTVTAASGGSLDCDVDSFTSVGTIYVAVQDTNHAAFLLTFTISNTTWALFSSGGTGPTCNTDVNGARPLFCLRRADSSIAIAYQGPQHGTGSAYRSVYVAACGATGSWTSGTGYLAATEADISTGNYHQSLRWATRGASDRFHLLYAYARTSHGLVQRSLSSANALDTAREPYATTLTEGGKYSIAYVNSRLEISGPTYTTTYRPPIHSAEDSQANNTWANDTNAVGNDVVATAATVFAYDATGAKLYAFFRDSATADVFANSLANYPTATTWTADGAVQDTATAATFISVSPVRITPNIGAPCIGVIWVDTSVYFDAVTLGAATGPVARISLASASTPKTQTNHKIHLRARIQAAATAIARVALYEGSTNRSTDLDSTALTTSLADYTIAISDANAANITDYSNLELRIWGYSSIGEAPVLEVADVWLELPSPAAVAPVTLACAAATATAEGRSMLLGLFPDAASATASGRSMLLGFWGDPATAAATTPNVDLTIPYYIAAQAATATATGDAIDLHVRQILAATAATATAEGRSMLLGLFPGSASATATGRSMLLGFWGSAGSAQASGDAIDLHVTQILQAATANATATGRSMLLAFWGDPATAAATTPTVALSVPAIVTLDLAPSTITATGRSMLLAFWSDAAAATSTGTEVTLKVGQVLAAAPNSAQATTRPMLLAFWGDPASAQATGADVTLSVPGVASLNCAASTATATGRAMLLGFWGNAASCSATGRSILLGLFPNPAGAQASGDAIDLHVGQSLTAAASSSTASGTANLTVATRLAATPSSSSATGRSMLLGFWGDPATCTATIPNLIVRGGAYLPAPDIDLPATLAVAPAPAALATRDNPTALTISGPTSTLQVKPYDTELATDGDQ